MQTHFSRIFVEKIAYARIQNDWIFKRISQIYLCKEIFLKSFNVEWIYQETEWGTFRRKKT